MITDPVANVKRFSYLSVVTENLAHNFLAKFLVLALCVALANIL